MIAGIGGGLVSEYFAEHLLAESIADTVSAEERTKLQSALARLRRSAACLGPASSPRAVFDVGAAPLAAFLGFRVGAASPLAWRREKGPEPDGVGIDPPQPHAIASTLDVAGTAVRMVVVPWGDDLDHAWRPALIATLQAAARWCLLFNGRHLRVVDSARSYSREHLNFDLDVVCSDAVAFGAFWTLARAAAFAQAPGRPAVLERAIAMSSRHSVGVCRSLRHGVLDALGVLTQGFLDAGQRSENVLSLFEQSLTLVYRLLFLLFAEARRMLPTWHQVFSSAYSVETLRAVAEDPNPDASLGLWETFQAISRLAHNGCRAGTLVVTPFNGRLFSPARTPIGEHGRVADRVAGQALVALSTTRAAKAGTPRQRIAYRDLGVEQLGAVYESILDYTPSVDAGPGRRRAVRLTAGSGRRKATGSFYTPLSLTRFLVRRTLYPLVCDASPDEILRLRILDPAMGSAAFLVAACHYLAAAYERALVAQGNCHPSDIDDRDRAGFRRAIAERCLYGVDRNPIAVQLARLSLWLATLAADRPLTFLDHHLATGDSLVGASPLDVMRVPPRRRSSRSRGSDNQPMLFAVDELQRDLEQVLPQRLRLSEQPSDSIDAVRGKERVIEGLARSQGAFNRWKRAVDAWCACWFLQHPQRPTRGMYHEMQSTIVEGNYASQTPWLADLVARAGDTATAQRFFHWSLEFPEIFFDATGQALANAGFDAVIGNPPWDMLRADSGPAGDQAYDRALLDFARGSGIYLAQSDGHLNRFQLFVERALQLARRGGRVGLVVPWGLFADHGCAPLRRRLFVAADTDTIVSFDNAKAIFPIHRSLRFALLTTTCRDPTGPIHCRFGETSPHFLDTVPDAGASDGFPFTISPAMLERLSGQDLAVPDVRAPIDLAILDRVSVRWPALSASAGWRAQFGRELNATDDKGHFIDRGTAAGATPDNEDDDCGEERFPTSWRIGNRELPVVEGKHVTPFNVRMNNVRYRIPLTAARKLLRGDVSFRRWRLAYRDVASATNRLTLIAAMLPPGCVSTHTLFCLKTALDDEDQWFLCAIMNSYVANYLVRLRVTTHVSASIVERLPVPFLPSPAGAGYELAQLARRIGRGTEVEALDRLQAIVGRLYGLSGAEFEHVLGTFPLVERERREAARRLFERMPELH